MPAAQTSFAYGARLLEKRLAAFILLRDTTYILCVRREIVSLTGRAYLKVGLRPPFRVKIVYLSLAGLNNYCTMALHELELHLEF